MGDISRNFNLTEFFNKDIVPGIHLLDKRLIERLQAIRDYFQQSITITSGFRTPEHNAKVGGAKNSQHLYGRAADFIVKGVTPQEVQEWYRTQDVTGGLGLGKTFTHIDVRWSNKLVVFDYA